MGSGVVEKEWDIWDVQVFWGTIFFIMNRRVWDVVDWGKDLRDFSFLDMIDFFKGGDG